MSAADLKSKVVPLQDNVVNDKAASKSHSNLKSTPTIIARDLVIEGEISSSGLIEIEGRIKGTIRGNSIILRENGFVEGQIIADYLSIRGGFDGKICAKNIDISSKAKVMGEIEYNSLSVEDGCSIDGNFKKMV